MSSVHELLDCYYIALTLSFQMTSQQSYYSRKVGAYNTFLWEDICKSDDISHYAGGTPETVDMFMQRLLAVAKKEFEVAQQCVKRKYHMMLGKANISTLFEDDSSATSHMEDVSDEYLNGIYSSYASRQYGASEGNRPKPIKDRHTKFL